MSVVREIASGAKRPAQACREYELSEGVLLRWRQEYEARGEAAFTPRVADGVPAEDRLEQRIAALERVCGQLAVENAARTKGLNGRAWRSATR